MVVWIAGALCEIYNKQRCAPGVRERRQKLTTPRLLSPMSTSSLSLSLSRYFSVFPLSLPVVLFPPPPPPFVSSGLCYKPLIWGRKKRER